MSKIVHIVTVKFKPEVSEEIRQETLRDVCDLKNDIPQIISASAGKNFTDRSKGYEYAWVIELKTKEDLSIYLDHSAHLEFIRKHKPLFADVLAIDYEA
ncbi:hypothetical protein G6F37_003265 [Rhizopus arrhizus]|nr:hypothetical protein G6F38_003409 [Rhizopus arrhizus]KAG1161232.1 hypothetical protein G6F37_003265 [Rhizopus arrhizus]